MSKLNEIAIEKKENDSGSWSKNAQPEGYKY